MNIRSLLFLGCVIAQIFFVSGAHAQLINGKPVIHVPKGYGEQVVNEFTDPRAIEAYNQKNLHVVEDQGLLEGFKKSARLDYPDSGSPNGYSSVWGKEDIAKKLEELAKPPSQPPKAQENYCVFMQGGNVQDTFDPGALPEGVTTAGAATGYGNYDSLDSTKSSIENQRLTETTQGTFEDRWLATLNAALANMTKNPGQGVKIYLPNAGQSVDGALLGEYNVDGVNVKTGTHYTIGKKSADGITVDENCKPTKGEVKDPGKENPGGPAPGFGGLGNGGGGGGNGGGGNGGGLGDLFGGGGGLGALLPLLMQGLLGGGQQGQGQYGQNQYGAGYGNGQQDCLSQPIAPVCAAERTAQGTAVDRTFKNQCFALSLGAVIKNTGVCVTPSTDSGQATVNSIVTLTQLSQSGIPTALLENVRNLVTTVLSNILSGGSMSETVVK